MTQNQITTHIYLRRFNIFFHPPRFFVVMTTQLLVIPLLDWLIITSLKFFNRYILIIQVFKVFEWIYY